MTGARKPKPMSVDEAPVSSPRSCIGVGFSLDEAPATSWTRVLWAVASFSSKAQTSAIPLPTGGGENSAGGDGGAGADGADVVCDVDAGRASSESDG